MYHIVQLTKRIQLCRNVRSLFRVNQYHILRNRPSKNRSKLSNPLTPSVPIRLKLVLDLCLPSVSLFLILPSISPHTFSTPFRPSVLSLSSSCLMSFFSLQVPLSLSSYYPSSRERYDVGEGGGGVTTLVYSLSLSKNTKVLDDEGFRK